MAIEEKKIQELEIAEELEIELEIIEKFKEDENSKSNGCTNESAS